MNKRFELHTLPISRLVRFCLAASGLAVAVLTGGCREAAGPVAAVTPSANPQTLDLPGITGDYRLKVVNDVPLPVRSPYGSGQWDYDADAGTWKLTQANFVVSADGTYANSIEDRAESGATSSQTFAGTYTRVSPSMLQIHANGGTTMATLSGNQLIWDWGNGTVLTFER